MVDGLLLMAGGDNPHDLRLLRGDAMAAVGTVGLVYVQDRTAAALADM